MLDWLNNLWVSFISLYPFLFMGVLYILSFISYALRKYPLLENEIRASRRDIEQLTTLYGFDDLITTPLHGFRNADDYYQQCSGIHYMKQVAVPLQVIHARDDPFMTDAVIPDFSLPNNISYQLYDHGGHVGFLSGRSFKPEFWLESVLPVYYERIRDSVCSHSIPRPNEIYGSE